MNCKPDDLAIIVGSPLTGLSGAYGRAGNCMCHIGRVVRVMTAYDAHSKPGDWLWSLEEPLRCAHCYDPIEKWFDSCLKPLNEGQQAAESVTRPEDVTQ
jgi:hypothetical protein